MAEEHVFEVEVRVRAHGQPDATVSREYHSSTASSTDKAASEVWAAVGNDVKARMTQVAGRPVVWYSQRSGIE